MSLDEVKKERAKVLRSLLKTVGEYNATLSNEAIIRTLQYLHTCGPTQSPLETLQDIIDCGESACEAAALNTAAITGLELTKRCNEMESQHEQKNQ